MTKSAYFNVPESILQKDPYK